MFGPGLARIYYFPSTNASNMYITVPISRWDEQNYNVIIETFLESGNRNTLFANVVPGGVSEMYNILGKPKYKDITYKSSNTLVIEPISDYGLSSIRQRRVIGVKNISDNFSNWEIFNTKIEGIRLDIE